MLTNWLKPVPLHLVNPAPQAADAFGNQIQVHQEKFPDLRHVRVALVGIHAREANAIRKELYSMSFPFENFRVADLGNAIRSEGAFLVQVLRELHEANIIPVLLGKDAHFVPFQYQALLAVKGYIHLILADDHLPISEEEQAQPEHYLNPLMREQAMRPFYLQLVAGQSHFIHNSQLKPWPVQQLGLLRLGAIRSNIQATEPILRDGDMFAFHLRALKQVEAPAVAGNSPSGLQSEEACQLARYAGMSDKLRSFGIYGFQRQLEGKEQTAQLAAQMIWYFLEGVYHRKNDFPVSTDGLVEYIVEFKSADLQLVFWRSTKSGRWWIQVPAEVEGDLQRHRLVPCSYQDYLQATEQELPERLLQALSRFDQ